MSQRIHFFEIIEDRTREEIEEEMRRAFGFRNGDSPTQSRQEFNDAMEALWAQQANAVAQRLAGVAPS